ncbi:hypothetical protein ABJI51_05620 [Amycolatopsis sp. NEAU-NG30]|uniref:Uncharacterized protein n=1 Tax=Amycolatopsis melonis TaxID=3156488 RepID=A0ABV0L8A2_9PSEU
MTTNENRPEEPAADLARSRQHIKEAKEAAREAVLAEPGEQDTAPEVDPPYHQGEQGTTPSGN